MDPRLSIINERLKNIERIIAVGSGKGGVGKSIISTTLALLLSKNNKLTGLFDLDFQGPTCHLILGAKDEFPTEEKGIKPPQINSVYFMSIYYFTRDNPLPLRGWEVTNLFRELLAITRWDNIEYLIIDMPPGVGDEVLELLKLINKKEILIVTTPSILSLNTVDKLVKLLKNLNIPIIGILENMRVQPSDIVKKYALENKINYLGYIPFDYSIEKYIGEINLFMKTKFVSNLEKILHEKILFKK